MAVVSNYFLVTALGLSVLQAGWFPEDPGSALVLWALAASAAIFGRPAQSVRLWNVGIALWALGSVYSLVLLLSNVSWIGSRLPLKVSTEIPMAGTLFFLSLALIASLYGKFVRIGVDLILLVPTVVIAFLQLLRLMYDPQSAAAMPLEIVGLLVVAALVAHLALKSPLRWPLTVLFSGGTDIKIFRYFVVSFSVVMTALGASFVQGLRAGGADPITWAVGFVFLSVTLFWFIITVCALWTYKLGRIRERVVEKLEESWRSRESYFRKLVDDSSVILYLWEPGSGATFISKKWEAYTGRPAMSDLGTKWLECIHPDDREDLEKQLINPDVSKFEGYSHQYRLRRWDGQYRWMITTGFPRFDDDGRLVGYMGNVIDIHERKAREEALKKDKQIAESSNQAKSQFLANMSHEIRTPLNAILGFAELSASETCSAADRTDYHRRIRLNGDHLLRLIDDILDLAKMESGANKPRKSRFSISRTLEEVNSSLKGLASVKGLALELEVAPDVPPLIYSDPQRIKQVLTNLVGNAIKFTEAGGVKMIARAVKENIEVEIHDSGIGVSQANRDHLFKPFSQADGSVTRKFGGTGLGLSLSRKLARSLGGDVTLKSSEPGGGSVFALTFSYGGGPRRNSKQRGNSFVLPPARSKREPHRADVLRSLFGRKILVAEDSPDSRELLRLYFNDTGAVVLFAENGLEAVDLALSERPDLILMDVQMPEMDGLEATRMLRNGGFKKPIVALTAHALQGEVDRSFEAGCNYHLTKPVMKGDVLALICELLPAHAMMSGSHLQH